MHRNTVLGGLAAALVLAFCGFAASGQATGDQQSPIVITGAIPARIQALDIRYPHGLRNFEVKNDGYTLKVRPLQGTYTLHYGNVTYMLQEFHFHYLAEHKVGSAAFAPMELHFVNAAANGDAVALGVFLDIGPANAAFTAIMRNPPPNKDAPPVTVQLDPNAFLPADRHYWMYMGSLTTPDYTQNVRWIVLKLHRTVDRPNYDRFKGIFPNGNKRDLEDTNRRFILEGPTP